MSERIDGAVTVVTGGATGLGRGLALEAARRGSHVMIGSIEDAGESAEMVRALGVRCEWTQVDVSDYTAMSELRARCHEHFGAVNIVVNNAATGGGGGLDVADPRDVLRLFEVNIGGVFHGIRVFADDLRAAAAAGGRAAILNVGSEHSLGVPPHVPPMSAYTTAKYAVLGLTENARRDLDGTGITVALVAPGWVLTERIREYAASSEQFRSSVEPIAQTTDEVARIAFDGLLAGEPLIVTNPASVEFALAHAQAMVEQIEKASTRVPADHPTTGDPSKCPVVGHLPGF